MNHTEKKLPTYLYTYSCNGGEHSLCALEARTLFGAEPQDNLVKSHVMIDPSRSPFIKERMHVMYEGESLQDLLKQVETLQITGETFKVVYVKNEGLSKTEKIGFENRRAIEKEVGLHINGEAALEHPKRLFGVMVVNGRWIFGDYVKSEPVWHRHQQKPHSYSTALNTRVARAVANIAVPKPVGIKAIDPCCGIGTVLVEALSMGIDIVGSDKNPLILDGVRENIAYFGLSGEVTFTDIRDVTNHYDVAIIDLPYNLCCAITPEQQKEILSHARRIAQRAVFVSVEPIDDILLEEGFSIIDRAVVSKGKFTREVIVCE
ncbi:TRM11 family SAM-dependent methyltransferase [Siminovitchia fordii]|uniref:TRM11 family SAM-dependent methyltransferase n=1 Tax=Siminovitchia fordii TaxID=254759 RepID=UPI000375033A|nr:hypothetical protein [Siminovitchia fordii]